MLIFDVDINRLPKLSCDTVSYIISYLVFMMHVTQKTVDNIVCSVIVRETKLQHAEHTKRGLVCAIACRLNADELNSCP